MQAESMEKVKGQTQMKGKNLIKDIQRGRGSARLADGATHYDNTDDSHVERTTPLRTKMKQMLAAQDAGINAKREASTTRKRVNQAVKPI